MNMRRIKELRRQQERSQADLAKLLKVSRVTISKLETGKQEASAEQLMKLANYFNVSVDFLLECEQTSDSNEVFNLLKILECEKIFIGNHCLTEEEREMTADMLKVLFRKYLK